MCGSRIPVNATAFAGLARVAALTVTNIWDVIRKLTIATGDYAGL